MLAPFFTIKSLVVTVHRCSINFLCIESQICIIKWWRETENGNTLVWVTPRSPSLSLQDIYAPHPTHISRENEAIPWECSNDDGLKNLCDLMLKPEQSVRVRLHDMVKKHHIAIILTDMASVIWFMIRGKCYFCIRTFVLNWSPLLCHHSRYHSGQRLKSELSLERKPLGFRHLTHGIIYRLIFNFKNLVTLTGFKTRLVKNLSSPACLCASVLYDQIIMLFISVFVCQCLMFSLLLLLKLCCCYSWLGLPCKRDPWSQWD